MKVARLTAIFIHVGGNGLLRPAQCFLAAVGL